MRENLAKLHHLRLLAGVLSGTRVAKGPGKYVLREPSNAIPSLERVTAIHRSHLCWVDIVRDEKGMFVTSKASTANDLIGLEWSEGYMAFSHSNHWFH